MIYIFDAPGSITPEEEQLLLAALPEQRLKKALAYRQHIDRLCCAAAYRLLCCGLEREYGITAFTLREGERGKPYLPEHPQIHFNLSHCREGCACIISDAPAGIDIQDRVTVSELVRREVCTDNELNQIAMSPDPEGEFFRIWTEKEAYLKMLGLGIAGGLKSHDTTLLRPHIASRDFGRYTLAAAKENSAGEMERLISCPVTVTA